MAVVAPCRRDTRHPQAQAWVAKVCTGPARRRLPRLLERLTDPAEPVQPLWLPRRGEIGAMLDIAVEIASRLISQLRRDGVIQFGGPRSATVDRRALADALRGGAG